jgi:hypothetical protein
MQDSALAGNSIIKSLKREYAIIKQNAGRKTYSTVFVHGSPCWKIESKRYTIIAVETMIQKIYAITSENRGKELSDIFFVLIWIGSGFLFSGYSSITSGIYKPNLLDRSDAAEPSGKPIFH